MGLAARFVSGYELEAVRDPGRATIDAWAEVYLPQAAAAGAIPRKGWPWASRRWRSLTRDPEMATPTTGSYRSAEASTMETSIRMVGGG